MRTDAGRWVEAHLRRPLSPFHHRAMQLLQDAFRTGIYNIPVTWKTVDWDCNEGIRFTLKQHSIATFDFSVLSGLVFCAHRDCIRVSIAAAAPSLFRVVMHQRKREGGMSRRHPTADEHMKEFAG